MAEGISSFLQSIPQETACWIAVLIFIALDVVFGTVKAVVFNQVSSTKARQGVMHKAGFIGAMLLCEFVDGFQGLLSSGLGIDFSVPTTTLCAAMIVICEIMSILEHIQEFNPDLNLWFLEDIGKKANQKGKSDEDNQ